MQWRVMLTSITLTFSATKVLMLGPSTKVYFWLVFYKQKWVNYHICHYKGCIRLRFQRILKDFFKIKKSSGIQLRLLYNVNKSCGIQLRQSGFFCLGNKICWYSIEISNDLWIVYWYSKIYRFWWILGWSGFCETF